MRQPVVRASGAGLAERAGTPRASVHERLERDEGAADRPDGRRVQ